MEKHTSSSHIHTYMSTPTYIHPSTSAGYLGKYPATIAWMVCSIHGGASSYRRGAVDRAALSSPPGGRPPSSAEMDGMDTTTAAQMMMNRTQAGPPVCMYEATAIGRRSGWNRATIHTTLHHHPEWEKDESGQKQ